MIKPPRPVRRPEEFYQVFLGGVDQDYMTTTIGGYTGCLRGLSVGGRLLDLTSKGADGIARGKWNFGSDCFTKLIASNANALPTFFACT